MNDSDWIPACKEGDPAVRLVYADWLGEHGDPRAEVIRTAIEYQQKKTQETFLTMLRVAHRLYAERTPPGQAMWVEDYKHETGKDLDESCDEWVWELEDYPTDILILWHMFPIMSLLSGLDVFTQIEIATDHWLTLAIPDGPEEATNNIKAAEPLLERAKQYWGGEDGGQCIKLVGELRELVANIWLSVEPPGDNTEAEEAIAEPAADPPVDPGPIWNFAVSTIGLLSAAARALGADFDVMEMKRGDTTQMHQELGSFWLCAVDITQPPPHTIGTTLLHDDPTFDYLDEKLLGRPALVGIEHYLGFRDGAKLSEAIKKALAEFDPFEEKEMAAEVGMPDQ